MNFLKWIGGGIGWAFGGPVGALLGFALGTLIDGTASTSVSVARKRDTTQKGDFILSLLVLSAAVMKADGKTLKSELEFVKGTLRKNFGEQITQDLIPLLGEILKKEIPLADVCKQINTNMNYEGRLQLLHYLYGIALADGTIHKDEVRVIDEISDLLRISEPDRDSIKAMYLKDTESDYKILEISRSATDDEVKKAFRKMAVKYHPDKLEGLGDEIKKSAEEKFKVMQQAYENIKKERGMN